jgi:hypothetical protein
MGYPNSPGHTPEISIDPRELKQCSLEEPLLDGYGVARPDRERQRRRKRRRAPIDEAGDFDAALDRARREAAGDRDRLLDGHAHNERVLPGERDFAEREEGPIGLDLHGNARFAQETLTKPRLDCALELRRRTPCARTRPMSGIEMSPAPSTEKELLRLSWPNTITRKRSPLPRR